MLKKCFGGIQKYIYWKMIFEPYQWNASPTGEGSASGMQYHYKHFWWETYTDKNIWKYQYEGGYSPLKLQIYIKTIKKCTVHMPCNCWQMNNVEKNLNWGHRALHVLQKRFVEHFNEMPTSWGSSAMHCHFTYDLYQAFQL